MLKVLKSQPQISAQSLLCPEELSNKSSMIEKAYHFILMQILNGELVPGSIIDRKAIGEELGASLAPVSLAITQLQSEGLIETIARKQTRVRLVNREDVRDQFILRLAMERQAVAMVHGDIIKNNKNEMIELAQLVDKHPPKDLAAWRFEFAYHKAIINLTNCQTLINYYQQVMRQNFFFALHSAHVNLLFREAPPQQHTLLTEKLCTEDPLEADLALQEHLWPDIAALIPSMKRAFGPKI